MNMGRRRRMVIKMRDPRQKTMTLLAFPSIEVTGECCWQFRNRNRGGQTFDVAIPGFYQPGWNIKALKQISC